MSIESIERRENSLVKVVKGLVAAHDYKTQNTLRTIQVDLQAVLDF